MVNCHTKQWWSNPINQIYRQPSDKENNCILKNLRQEFFSTAVTDVTVGLSGSSSTLCLFTIKESTTTCSLDELGKANL